MELDRRPTVEELKERSVGQLVEERAGLPTDDILARPMDTELRDRYTEAIQAKEHEGVQAP